MEKQEITSEDLLLYFVFVAVFCNHAGPVRNAGVFICDRENRAFFCLRAFAGCRPHVCGNHGFNCVIYVRNNRLREPGGFICMCPPRGAARLVLVFTANHAEVMAEGSLNQVFFVHPDAEMLQKMTDPDAGDTHIQRMVRYRASQMMCLISGLLKQLGAENILPMPPDVPADFLFFRFQDESSPV